MEAEVEQIKRNPGYKYKCGPFYIDLYENDEGENAADRLLNKLAKKNFKEDEIEEEKDIFIQTKMKQEKIRATGGEWDIAVQELKNSIFGGI
jgi:hypothetical protein